jgi:hypothetical protein
VELICFLVLRGFLITWILLAEIEDTGTIDIMRFDGRRFLRLTPAYVSMLIFMLVGAVLLDPPSRRCREFLSRLPHLRNTVRPIVIVITGHDPR